MPQTVPTRDGRGMSWRSEILLRRLLFVLIVFTNIVSLVIYISYQVNPSNKTGHITIRNVIETHQWPVSSSCNVITRSNTALATKPAGSHSAAVAASTSREADDVTQYPVYRKRKQTAEEVCRGLRGGVVRRAVQHEPTNSAYCITAKAGRDYSLGFSISHVTFREVTSIWGVGCTFWLSVFRWLHNDTWGQNYSSPLVMPRYKVHQPSNLRVMKYFRFKRGQEPAFLHERFKFMFVREPYHRLWSAYVDKFLLPDLWHVDGNKILRHRANVTSKLEHTDARNVKRVFKRSVKLETTDAKTSNRSKSLTALTNDSSSKTDAKEQNEKHDVTKDTRKKQCSDDVTFTDFLDYVTSEKPLRLNEHYRPYHFLCSPCIFRPQVIGKMETFEEDSGNILQRLNLSWVGKEVGTTEERALHEMKMLIDDNFYGLRSDFFKLKDCMNSTELAWRLWKAFQINGYLPRNVSFPLRPGQSVTMTQFRDLVFSTYRHTGVTSKQFWRDQKTRAFVDAYREVPDRVLEKVRKVFDADFRLFDYDPYPELVYSYRKIHRKR